MKRIRRAILLAACVITTTIPATAAPLNQLMLKAIYKNATHDVYFSPDWLKKLKGEKYLFEITVLLDYNSKDRHIPFEGNQPYQPSETSYIVNCKNKTIAFSSDTTYDGHMASGKQLDEHARPWRALEYIGISDLNAETDSTGSEIDSSYKEIISLACKITKSKK